MKRSTKKKMRRALGLSMAVAMTMSGVPEGKLFDWKGIQIQAADTAKTIDASTVVQQVESATSNTPGIPDGVLLKELKRLVNTSLNRPVDNEITFKELLSYEGEIDLSAIGNQITSISGLGYARKAKKIVLTNVPVKAIDDYEFDGCTGLQEIVLPSGLEKIGKNAFRNCNSLSTIVLPETMKTIGESAFDACTSIENINLPNSIEIIEKGAFGGCKGLKEAAITNPKIVLGASVFESCENLESVSLPEGITEIPTSFFAQTGIKSIKVPSTVKVIKQSAFNNAYRLSEIDLTGCTGLTTLESSAFSLSAIESIKLPNSLTTIKSNCFDSCRGLKEITIPDSVQGKGDGTGTGIETLAFWRCYSLEKVSLPSGLSVLQNGLFTSCWNLKEVEIRNSANSVLETIGSGAFSACHSLSNTDFLKELRNLKRIEDGAFAYSKFTKEEEEVEFFEYTGTRCKLKEKDIYGDAIYSLGLRSVLIPDSVTYLGNEIFAGQPNIEKVTLGNGIKSIPDKTFKDCSFLKELTLPLQLKTIGNNAFSGCSRLQDVTLPTTLETIGDEAFSDCGVVKTAQRLYCDVRYIPSDAVYDSRPAGNTTATECLLYQKDENGNQDISMKFVEKDKCLTESAYKKVENPSAYRKCAIIAEKKYAKTENITTVKGTGTNAYTAYTYDASQKRVVGYQVLYTDKKNDAFSADNAVNVPTGGYTEFLVRSGTSGTRLNEKMYFGMSNLVIPNSVKTIGKKAFYNCYNLKNITISNQVIEIPESAFAVSDGNLLRVYDWVDNAYESVNYNFETNTFESRKYICDRLVTLPNSLEIIGDKAFQNNGNMKLSFADLPDTLLTIGKSAFADCHSLTSVVIPSKVKTIGDSAFWGCSEYEKAKVKGPGKYDVYYVDEKSGLKDLNLTQAASLETVGTNAFGLTPIVQCTLPEKVTVVPNGLFSYCEYLTKVVCSNNTTEVKDDVFRDCYSLVSITIPAKSTISYNAFRGNGIGAFNFSITDPEPYSISIGEEEILPINTFLSKYLRDTPQIKEKNGETGFLESAEGKIEKVNGQEVYKVGVKGIKEGTTQVSVVGTSNYLLYDSTVLTKAPEVTITLNVTKQKCTGIEDKRSSVVMGIDNGAGVTVNPQVLPADCSESNEWSSSNESIVSVIPKTYIQSGVEVASSSAVLMPKSFGTSKVTLKTGSVKKDYQVNVVVPATGITLDQQELSTKEGSKDRIKLNATMTYDTAKYSTTDWENHKDVLDYQSSDEKIVTVSPEGVVTPVKAGTATITVTALGGGKTAVCKVRVLPDETVVFLTDATGTVWDTEKTVSVQAKEPIVLNIATEPVDSLAELTWEFSDKTMFSHVKNTTKYVDTEDKGQQEKVVSMEFTGDKIGTGIITIYPKNCKNKQAVSSKVTVHIRADVQDAAFATVTELEEGKEQSVFGYIVSPAGKAEKIADIPKITTDQISFVSSNPEIATVDAKTGVVKAVKEGKVTISMEATNSIDGSKKTVKTLELDIVKPAVTDIIVTEKGSTRNYGTVSAGETIQLAISMIPQGSTDKVTYTSENPKVAKVDENGKITGVSAGTCKINVTTEKKGITKTFTVTVTAPAATPKPQATKKPAKITVSRVTGVKAVNQKGKKVKVSWKKLGSVKGYRITLALNKKFTSGKKVFLVNKGTTVSKVITKLKKGKTYYVKVEAYKVSGKKKIFGKASIIKKVLVKK